MVYKHISSDLKECGLRLWNSGWSKQDICSVLCFSRSSLYRWSKFLDTFGSVNPPRSVLQGRPRIIGIAAMTTIKAIYAQNCDTYLDELQWHLAIYHDIAISIPALHATLVRAGLTRKILRKIATERDEARRAEFMHCIRHNFSGSGKEFVVVDESSKNDNAYVRGYGRAPSGQAATLAAPFIRGQRYSLVAAMNVSGYLAAHVVPGSIDAFEFFDFIVEDVIPVMKPFPEENSVLIMDNCRIHHTDALLDVLNALQIMLLYLPPYSPDLSPIEESFSSWKAYLRRHGSILQEIEDPILLLLESTGCITAEKAAGWFRHIGYIVHGIE